MALLGEQYAGAAQGVSDVVMITLGTGIGGAAMMLGKLVRGAHAHAANLGGHLPVSFRGHKYVCGNVGCAEAEAAGWSLPRIVRETPGFRESSLANAQLNFQTLFAAARNEDVVARTVQQHCLNIWAANAVAVIHAYDPEMVVFDGGVMQSADVILPLIQKYVVEHAWTSWERLACAGILGGNATLMGQSHSYWKTSGLCNRTESQPATKPPYRRQQSESDLRIEARPGLRQSRVFQRPQSLKRTPQYR